MPGRALGAGNPSMGVGDSSVNRQSWPQSLVSFISALAAFASIAVIWKWVKGWVSPLLPL